MPKAAKDKKVKKERRLTPPEYRSFRLSRRIKHSKPRLTGSFRLFAKAVMTLTKNKRALFGVALTAFVLNLILVRGFASSSNLTDLKTVLDSVFTGRLAEVTSSASLFLVLVTGSGQAATESGALYQSFLLVLFSLVYIWVLRHTVAAKPRKVGIRESFYKSMYPFIPFVVVLFIIALQLLPFAAANFLYSSIITGGLAVTLLEQVLWLLIIILLATLSLYMVSSSLFGLYVVTLPDMSPMQALSSARDLVKHRRWSIMRKVFSLPILMLVIGAALVMPVIVIAPAIAEWVFYILTVFALPLAHSYFYNLYRELL